MLRLILMLSLLMAAPLMAEQKAVDIYSQAQLLKMIRSHTYLQQIKSDNCQIVQDIEAHADVLKEPLYQYLWGEMLNYGVCVKADPASGIQQLRAAAEQGSAEAMVRLAEYYAQGKFLMKDKQRAVQYVYPAAANGDLPAQMMLVKLFGEGYGSPRDYMMAYHWLYNQTFNDAKTQEQASVLLAKLAGKLPASQLEQAKKATVHR
ncbi:tetratricopeptide repeat protein [Shewanella dokdonensis]|uniref:Sel1 repeat family protein n=1 Tax=Shewanella dokdonensis TaxID=712036 RepID=A0ABX8DHE1_9GAMM|nr:SEL1-like repeat protein [Shewanella dokdonensis]MCL1075848.1 SEL1-like repeat protein [Shewanella dokdonensis]QVK24184.1 sel1 repeat family protein [Shewanella dokdonensis]